MKLVRSIDWRETTDISPARELYQVPQDVTGLHRITVFTSMIGNSGGVRPWIEWYNADNSLLRSIYLGSSTDPVNAVNNTAIVFPRPGTTISLGVDQHNPADMHYLVMCAIESFSEQGDVAQQFDSTQLLYLAAASLRSHTFDKAPPQQDVARRRQAFAEATALKKLQPTIEPVK